jgi:hypothetical protein
VAIQERMIATLAAQSSGTDGMGCSLAFADVAACNGVATGFATIWHKQQVCHSKNDV